MIMGMMIDDSNYDDGDNNNNINNDGGEFNGYDDNKTEGKIVMNGKI